jgi:hypothetical protein
VGEELGRLRQDLHQALRAGRRRPRVELRLRVDDGRDQRRIKMLVGSLLADDVRVLERERQLVDGLAEQRQRQDDRQARKPESGEQQQRPPPPGRCPPRSRHRAHPLSMARIADNFASSSPGVPSLTTT